MFCRFGASQKRTFMLCFLYLKQLIILKGKDMKKLFLMTTLCATFCFVFECGAEIVSGDKCGDNCTWIFDTDSGKLTISGTGDMYAMGASYNSDLGRYQTSAPWKEYDRSITTVSIGNGITEIGEAAFYNTTVQSVNLPDSLSAIHPHAFQYSSLQNVEIPYGVETIEHSAFCNTEVQTLVVPETVISIDPFALGSNDLKKIVFEGDVGRNFEGYVGLNKNMFWNDMSNISVNSIYCDASNESCNALKTDSEIGSKIRTYEKDKSGALKIGEDYYATANDLMNNNKCAGGLTDSCITAALNNKAQNLKSKGKCSDDAECEALVNADYNGEILEVGGKKYASLQDLYDGNEIVQEPVSPAIEPTGDNGGSTGEVSPVAESIFNKAERGKRIYTLKEAKDAAGKKNRVMIRYK